MDKKAFYAHLDQPGHSADNDPDGLADLLAQVAELTDTQPDDAYWRQFNTRLQRRLQQEPRPRPPWYARLFRPAVLAGFAGVCTALVVVLLVLPRNTAAPSLAALDDAQLHLLARLYTPYAEEPGAETDFAPADLDLLLDVLEETPGFHLYENPDDLPDADTLKDLWNLEG